MNKAAFILLLLTAFLAPFSGFLGSGWSNLFVCLLPLVALLLLIFERWEESIWLRIPPGFNALIILVILGMIQLLPLPPQLVRFLSPNAWAIYQETVGVLQADTWLPLTLAPKATMEALFRLVGCWAIYMAAANLLVERNRLKIFAVFMIALGGSFAAVILGLWGGQTVFSLFQDQKTLQSGISVQHTAIISTFMVMVCTLSIAQFLAERPTVRFGSLQERLSAFVSSFSHKKYLIYGLPAGLIPLAIATHWPNGLLVILLAVLLFLALLCLRSRGRQEISYLFGYLFLVFILAISLLPGGSAMTSPEEGITEQVAADPGASVPREVFSDFLLTGSGYGTFSAISRRYGFTFEEVTSRVSPSQSFFRLASQGGLIGLVATGWFLVTFFYRTFRSWRDRRQKLASYLYAASLGGGLAFAICYLSLGGVGLGGFPFLAFLMLGFTAASVKSSDKTVQEEEYSPLLKPLAILLTMAGVFFTAFFNLGDLAAKKYYDNARDLVTETPEALKASRTQLERATFFDPLNSRYRYALGYQAMDPDNDDLALGYFAHGVRLDPLDSKALYGLGQFLFTAGKVETAQKLLYAALKSDPNSREIQSAYVDQLLKTEQITKAMELIRQLLQTSSDDTLFWIQNVADHGISEPLRTRILPDKSRSYHDYGLYLLQRGDAARADIFFRKALGLARQEDSPDKSIFLSMVNFFELHQSYDEALDALLVAREKYPEDIDFLLSSGRIYQEMGITYKAKEIYQKILILDANNEDARQRLELMEGIL